MEDGGDGVAATSSMKAASREEKVEMEMLLPRQLQVRLAGWLAPDAQLQRMRRPRFDERGQCGASPSNRYGARPSLHFLLPGLYLLHCQYVCLNESLLLGVTSAATIPSKISAATMCRIVHQNTDRLPLIPELAFAPIAI